jgi:photoactive yellow protein
MAVRLSRATLAYHLPVVQIEQIPNLSEAELDALPQAIIRLDKTGKILYYSHAQAELAQRTIATTVGLNFFAEVAPCTAVRDFQGRFNDFVAKAEVRIESFTFDFRFPWGLKKVSIAMVKPSGPDSSVYIVVTTAESGSL